MFLLLSSPGESHHHGSGIFVGPNWRLLDFQIHQTDVGTRFAKKRYTVLKKWPKKGGYVRRNRFFPWSQFWGWDFSTLIPREGWEDSWGIGWLIDVLNFVKGWKLGCLTFFPPPENWRTTNQEPQLFMEFVFCLLIFVHATWMVRSPFSSSSEKRTTPIPKKQPKKN